MRKIEPDRTLLATNCDNAVNSLTCNNLGQTRQMLLQNYPILNKKFRSQTEAGDIIYGDPTPHDRYNAGA